MAAFFEAITPELAAFLEAQPVFFVASAASTGRINLSPKGMDTLRCLDARTIAYLDLTGSGNETAAHLRANGRLTLMCCAFSGRPQILRLYGRGDVVPLDSERGNALRPRFPDLPGARQFVVLTVESVQTSCGFAVPQMEMLAPRETLVRWAESKGDDGLREYRQEKNTVSIDGLPTGLVEPLPEA